MGRLLRVLTLSNFLLQPQVDQRFYAHAAQVSLFFDLAEQVDFNRHGAGYIEFDIWGI